jgi:hypothetical protein
MKPFTAVMLSLVLAICALPAAAQGDHNMAAMSGGKATTKTVTGEVVDLGCYLGDGARGAKHVSCATKCLNKGMPIGLLTANGTLYLVTLDHANSDPYNSLKAMAGKDVAVTGNVLARSGMTAIEATTVKLASK